MRGQTRPEEGGDKGMEKEKEGREEGQEGERAEILEGREKGENMHSHYAHLSEEGYKDGEKGERPTPVHSLMCTSVTKIFTQAKSSDIFLIEHSNLAHNSFDNSLIQIFHARMGTHTVNLINLCPIRFNSFGLI